jgi:DNA repair exonuclease SbcCD nuclease subunit
MTKILAIGDPHFMLSNLSETKRYTKKIVSLIKSEAPDLVVVLGDVFHTHEKKHILVEKEVTYFLKNISNLVTVYLLVGNHDMINSQQFLTTNHAFSAYKYWDNLIVCDKPLKLVLNDKLFIFTPFTPPGKLFEALDTLDNWKSSDCVFAHQEIHNCYFNPTTLSEHGDKWDESFPMLISGHIHDEQWIGKNVYYPGSSMQHGYSENSEKIVCLATFEDSKIPTIERYDLGMKRKKIVYIDIGDLDSFKIPNDETIKLVIKGTPEEIKTIRKRKDYHDLVFNTKVSFIPREFKYDVKSKKKSVIEILKDLVINEPDNVKQALEVLLREI